MRPIAFLAFGALAAVLQPAVAAAQLVPTRPPRDYFLNAPPPGQYAHLDAYTIGAQTSYEWRGDIEEGMSMLHARASGIVSYPYAEGSANLDLRVFLVSIGGSYGYRWVYRNFTFAPNETDRSRDRRIELESEKAFTDQDYDFYEGRFRLNIPLDWMFMVNTATLRHEDAADNSFDWLHANIHDAGTLTKIESTLFFRHRDFGAIGPYFRYLNLPRTDPQDGLSKRVGEVAYGFAFGTRPGFVKPIMGNIDLFLLQVMFRFGDEDFGLHAYRIPAYLLAVYRVTLGLDRNFASQSAARARPRALGSPVRARAPVPGSAADL